MNSLQSDERGLLLSCPKCGQRNRIAYGRLGQIGRCGKCQSDLPHAVCPVDVSNRAAFESLTSRSPLPVLVDFWAPWCGPCRMMAPELDKVAAAAAGQILVAKLNTEEVPDVAQRFGVTSIPMLALLQGGRELSRQAGAMPARAIQQFMEQALQRMP